MPRKGHTEEQILPLAGELDLRKDSRSRQAWQSDASNALCSLFEILCPRCVGLGAKWNIYTRRFSTLSNSPGMFSPQL
jgi:hypothetical protein